MNGLYSELRTALHESYGDRLRGVHAFGSYARGEAGPESDADVVIVLDEVPHYAVEIDRTSQIVGDLSLRYGVSVSRVFISEKDWRTGESQFLGNVREDAIEI